MTFTYDDPLDPDLPQDATVVTTRRALCRVATVAAEAGARFQREASGVDPMGWMLSPRRMFDGSPAIEACLDREHFVRAIILHGLSLGLDAEPDVFGQLQGADGEDERAPLSRPNRGRSRRCRSAPRQTLYCATISYEGEGVLLQAFHASVARHPSEVVQRLRSRFGEDVVDLVEIRAGFHPAAPLAIALVPNGIANMLRRIEKDADSSDYSTFAVDIEQRLEA
ncbi:hypothetical protein LQ953_03395 [Sphingomonas sp. IC-56]|nr:hypothetical protein [Sphingomonas sp. IC-56]